MASVLRPGRVVLGYALTFDSPATPSSACVQHPLGLAVIRRDDERGSDPFFQASGVVCSLPLLTRAAGASGFLNAAPDPDGLLRRVPLLAAFNGQVYPGLALAAVLAAKKTRDVSLRVINVNTASLAIDRESLLVDGKSNLLLRYRGAKRTFPHASAADVLSGRTPAAAFTDKIVFVGTTALGTARSRFDAAGHALCGRGSAGHGGRQSPATRLHSPLPSTASPSRRWACWRSASSLRWSSRGSAWSGGAAGAAVCLAVVWGGTGALMSTRGIFVSPLFPTLGLIASFGTIGTARYILEHHRADREGHDKVMSQRLMVQTLLSLTEVRDVETGRHSRRTQEYARVLATRLATNPEFRAYLTPERIDLLASLAPLHDIGKVGVPDRLLNKAGLLTAEETVEMRKHPGHGRDVIEHAERDVGSSDDAILAMAKDIVYTHHEKWDGSGYPEGLRGPAIPIAGRLMAVVG